jgi:hypothetical protein
MKGEQLKVGNKVQLSNGATAEVISEPIGADVRIKYLDSPFDSDQVGKEETCSVDDILGHYTEDDTTRTAGQLG